MLNILCGVEELRKKEVVPFIDMIALQQEIASKCQPCGSGILMYRRMHVKFVTDLFALRWLLCGGFSLHDLCHKSRNCWNAKCGYSRREAMKISRFPSI